jgi:CRISPR-associated endonuclease/helicase Cas3
MGHLYHLATFQPSPVYYAHSKEGVDESEWQLLKEHLIATSVLAAELGTDAGVSELARAAGLLHDIGKYAQVFQERLRGSPQRVDHATAGAKEVMALFTSPSTQNQAELLSYCIAGHHSGLPNYGTLGDLETDGTLLARRVKKRLADYSVYKTELDVTALQLTSPRIKGSRFRGREKGYTYFSIAFLTRMIFSALVDADSLDTEQYTQEGAVQRGNYASLRELALEFDRHMQRFSNPRNAIHQKRTETLHACLARAEDSPGIFTLTVPTGGAKTLSSMAFALKHALAHGLKRILYVIPFTSIIEQNAAVFRTAFGSLGLANVLEHHSNLDWGRWTHEQEEDGSSVTEKLRLAGENWDIPVVVTTNVQFFESLFANKRQAARKLHRLAKSVIIFDEVQMLPREFMKPCILAISELVQNYGSSIVFSTATQPALQEFFDTQIKFTELAPDPPALFSFYRRVAVKDIGELSDEMLLERLRSHLQVLCVVNTRRHAAGLYRGLSGEGNFHLSTLMCPVHRQQTLLQIRQRLQEGLVCRVISTQVLEAGIDIDFPVGYRALAGLDSIIQAAGRVNREGRQESGEVWVFRPKTPFIKRIPRYIEQAAAVTQMILRDHDDPVSVEAIWSYYRQLYSLQDESGFDARRIVDCFEKKTGKLDFDFKTAAENFTLIDENTVALIVPYNSEVTALLAALTPAFSPALLRRLQPFTINLFEREFAVLQSQGVICTVHDRLHLLDQAAMQEYYHPETGLILPEESSGRSIFFD